MGDVLNGPEWDIFLPEWVRFQTKLTGLCFYLSYVLMFYVEDPLGKGEDHGGILRVLYGPSHTSYVFAVKLENKIHIINIVC